LEEVSTTRGSGWVRSHEATFITSLEPLLRILCGDSTDLLEGCAPTRYRGWYWPLPSSTADFWGKAPFELGIDYGCRRISTGYLRKKRFLVLGAKPHDYKRALSDLGGIDAKSHANDPEKAVIALRNWFVDTVHLRKVPSGSILWEEFVEFRANFHDQRKKDGFTRRDLKTMPVREYIAAVRHWLKTHN